MIKMDTSKIHKDKMKYEYACQIADWKYEGEYSVYNMPSLDEMKNKGYSILNKDKANNYICYLIDNEVIAYVNIKDMNNKKIFIGIGLKPKYCGKGNGNYFLNDSLKEIKKRFNGYIIYLEVRSWNKRAIKSYEKIGFKIVSSEIKKDCNGNDSEFIIMEY